MTSLYFDFKKRFAALSPVAGNSIRLTRMIRSDQRNRLIGLIMRFLFGAFAAVARSGMQGLLLNELPAAARTHTITRKLILLLVLSIVVTLIPQLLVIVRDYLNRLFAFYLEQRFAIAIAEKKGQLDLAILEDPEHNDLINVVSEQGGRHVQAFADRQFYLLESVASLLLAISIFAVSSWWILLMIIPAAVPELLIGIRYGRHVWGIHHSRSEVRRHFTELCGHFGNAAAVSELKVFQNTGFLLSKIKSIFQRFHSEERENERQQVIRVVAAWT